MLLRRWSRPASEAIEALVGLQAQNPGDPYVGLWSRLEGFQPEELAQLLLDRQAVRCTLMRGTIHLVSARDALGLRPIMQPVLDRQFKGQRLVRTLKGLDIEEFKAACVGFLEEKPRTRAEIRKLLEERWPDHDSEALSFVLYLIPLVQVPPRGIWGRSGRATWALMDDWLAGHEAPAMSIDDVILRYLGAFGPASPADAQQWSGLTRLNEVFERLRPQIAAFRSEDGRELFDLPDAPRPGADVPAPTRFLPVFDNLTLSHADRSRVVSGGHRNFLLRAWEDAKAAGFDTANFATFLVDGFIAGAWWLEKQRSPSTLVVRPLRTLSGSELADLEEEAVRLLSFLAPDSVDRDVRITAFEG